MKTVQWSTHRVARQVERSLYTVPPCWEPWTGDSTATRRSGSEGASPPDPEDQWFSRSGGPVDEPLRQTTQTGSTDRVPQARRNNTVIRSTTHSPMSPLPCAHKPFPDPSCKRVCGDPSPLRVLPVFKTGISVCGMEHSLLLQVISAFFAETVLYSCPSCLL